MFEGLSEKLERSFKVLKGQAYITEVNVADTMKEIRRALLDADVSYKIAKDVTNNIKEKALGQEILTSVKPGEMMVKIVHDELAELMGGDAVDINLKGQPSIILIAGLQGSGKTTFSAKLASYLKRKRSKQVLLVAGDVYRPAAIEQLKVLGQQVEVEVYSEEGNKNPVQIAQNAINHARSQGKNVVIIDTAGRLAVDEEMMNEIANIKEKVHPHETLFVVDSMTGQDAVNTAKAFNDRLDFDGVVLTKLPSPSARWWRSPSSSSVSARRWTRSMCSTPSAWPTVSSAWATLSASWNAHKSNSTRKKPASCRRNWHRTSSTTTTS